MQLKANLKCFQTISLKRFEREFLKNKKKILEDKKEKEIFFNFYLEFSYDEKAKLKANLKYF